MGLVHTVDLSPQGSMNSRLLHRFLNIIRPAFIVATTWFFVVGFVFDSQLAFFVTGSFDPGTKSVLPTVELLVTLGALVALAFTGRESLPRGIAIAVPCVASSCVLVQLPPYYFHLEATSLNLLGAFGLSLSIGLITVMAWMALAKTEWPTDLLAALLLASGMLSLLLLLASMVGDVVRLVIVALAPFMLLLDRRSLQAEATDHTWFVRLRALGPAAFSTVALGVCGGIVAVLIRAYGPEGALSPLGGLEITLLNAAYSIMTIQSIRGKGYPTMAVVAAAQALWGTTAMVASLVLELTGRTVLPLMVIVVCLMLFLSFAAAVFRPHANVTRTANQPPDEGVKRLVQEGAVTSREAEVLTLLLQGRSVPFIQDRLSISEGTVRTHVHNIYRKLSIHSRQELLTMFAPDVLPDISSADEADSSANQHAR